MKGSPETSDELDAVKRDRDFWRAQVMDEDGPLMEENYVLRLLLKEGHDLSLSNQRAASMRHRLVEWGDRVEVALRTNYERE